MSQVNRVYHLRARDNGGAIYRRVLPHGGATVLVSGVIGSNQVSVRVAWCNTGHFDEKTGKLVGADTYSRKRGINVAEQQPEKIIPLRQLPGFLGRTYREVQRRARTGKAEDVFHLPKFDNRVLEFLPKDLSEGEPKTIVRRVLRAVTIPVEQEAA